MYQINMRRRLGPISIPSGVGDSNTNSSNKRAKRRKCHSPEDDNDEDDEGNARVFQWNNAPPGVINPQYCPYYLKEPDHKDFAESGKFHKSCRLKHIPKLLQHIRRTHTKPEQCGRCGFRGDAGQVKEHKGKLTKCEKKDFEGVSQEDLRIEGILKSSKQGLSSSELFKAIFGSSPDYQYAKNYEACEKALPALSEVFQEYSRLMSEIVWRVAHRFREFSPFKKFSKSHPDANFDALGVKFWIERHILNLFASITEPSGIIASDVPVSTQSVIDHSASQTLYQAQLETPAFCSLIPQQITTDATNSPSVLIEPRNYQPVSHFGRDISQSSSSPTLSQARKDNKLLYNSRKEDLGDINSLIPGPKVGTQQGNQPDCKNLLVAQSSMGGAQPFRRADDNSSSPELYRNDLSSDRSFLIRPSHLPPKTAPHSLPEDENRAILMASNSPIYSQILDIWPSDSGSDFSAAKYNQINGVGSQSETIPGPIASHTHVAKYPLSQGHQLHHQADNNHMFINPQFADQPQLWPFNDNRHITYNSFGTECGGADYLDNPLSTPQSGVERREPESLNDSAPVQVEDPSRYLGYSSWG